MTSESVVIDIGSGTTKIGLAGGDLPSMWEPTLVGTTLSSSSAAQRG